MAQKLDRTQIVHPWITVCNICSAEAHVSYACNKCIKRYDYCEAHRQLATVEQHVCPPEGVLEARRQIASRGDFAIDRIIIGEQSEKRYFFCGPADAKDGVTLANLRAVWHLIGQVLEDES